MRVMAALGLAIPERERERERDSSVLQLPGHRDSGMALPAQAWRD